MALERDVILDVLTRSDTRGLSEAANGLDKLAAGVDTTSGHARRFTTDLKQLNTEVAQSRLRIAELQHQYAVTGDRSLFGDLRKERSFLRDLKQLADEVAQVGATKVIDVATPRLGRTLVPAIIAGVVGAGVTLSPWLGAMIAGAVSGAVGTGGVAGGLVMASREPAVQAAARRLGDFLMEEVFSGGDAFVQPAIRSLAVLEAAVRKVDLESVFAPAAATVETIARGIGGMLITLGPGLQKAFENMGPFADVAAEGFTELGANVGKFLVDITSSKGAVMGLEAAFQFLIGAIRVTGIIFDTLADIFGFVEEKAHNLVSGLLLLSALPLSPLAGYRDQLLAIDAAFNDLETGAGGATGAVTIAAGGIRDLGTEGKNAANELESLLGVVDQLIPGAFSLEEAQDAAANAVARLAEQLGQQAEDGVEGAGSLDRNTQAGRDNAAMVRDLVDMYAGLIVKAGGTREAQQALKEELRNLLTQMGLNSETVQYYVDQLDRVPTDVITTLTVEAAQALQAIQETERELMRMQKSYTITINHDDVYRTFREGERASWWERQHGGPAEAYGTYLVGEHEPEILQMGAQSGHIYTAQQWAGTGGGIDYEQMAQAIQRALAGVTVILDGQRVGSVQARTANLYARGG